MDLETIMLSEMSDGKGQEVYDFIHMWDMKQKATKEQTKTSKTQTRVWG